MPKGYHQLTRDQRCQIATLKSIGFSQYEIAKEIGVSPSSISRELKRNGPNGKYSVERADLFSVSRRRQASSRAKRMTYTIIKKIENHLKEDWSPQQISGRLKLENINVSHESIYKYVWKNKSLGGDLYKHLRHHGKKYNKRSSGNGARGCIVNRVDIAERPAIVETKSRIGDWEADTIIGIRKKSAAILSFVDRHSKLTILEKLVERNAKSVVSAVMKRFSTPSSVAHTITFDNGQEFSSHEIISEKIGANCYFARPYHAWERGLNEHTNGLIRQYFPKSQDLTEIPDEEIRRVEELLNNRPRKVIGYKTPKEVYLMALSEPARNIALQS